MSITLLTNSLTVASSTLSRKLGSVLSSALGTSSSSPPAGAKFSARKELSSELLDNGWLSLLNAAITSSTGLSVGLGGDLSQSLSHLGPSGHGVVGSSHANGWVCDLHVHKCLGVGKGPGKLNRFQDVALA